MKKIILTSLTCILSLALISCKNKTTKKTTKENTTTKTKSTTVDPNPIPKRYRISKEIYDSYFNPTVDQVFALNMTIDETSVWGEGESAFEMKTEYKIAKGKVYSSSDNSYSSNSFISFTKENDESIYYEDYMIDFEGLWNLSSSGTITPKKTLFYTLGASFDYEKLEFDLDKNVYKSDELLKEEREDSSYEYSNLIIKFDENKIISMSYHIKQTLHDEGTDEIFIGDITRNISNIGTTEIITPLQKYMVDKELFDSYFNIKTIDELIKLNYKIDIVDKDNFSTAYSNVFVNYDKYLINDYTYCELSKKDGSNTYAYVESYHYDKNTHKITKESSYNQDMDYSVCSAYKLDYFTFDDFKFNYENKVYECASVDVDKGVKYKNVKIYFEDNIIKKYTYTQVLRIDDTDYISTITKTFSNVGTTTIDISE